MLQKGNFGRPRSAEDYRQEAVRCRKLADNKAFTNMTRKNFALMAATYEDRAREIDLAKLHERPQDGRSFLA
jgi:hypothetical protein